MKSKNTMNGKEFRRYLTKIVDDFNVERLEKAFDVQSMLFFIDPHQTRDYLRSIEFNFTFSPVIVKREPIDHDQCVYIVDLTENGSDTEERLSSMAAWPTVVSKTGSVKKSKQKEKSRRSSKDSSSTKRRSKKRSKESRAHEKVENSILFHYKATRAKTT